MLVILVFVVSLLAFGIDGGSLQMEKVSHVICLLLILTCISYGHLRNIYPTLFIASRYFMIAYTGCKKVFAPLKF